MLALLFWSFFGAGFLLAFLHTAIYVCMSDQFEFLDTGMKMAKVFECILYGMLTIAFAVKFFSVALCQGW